MQVSATGPLPLTKPYPDTNGLFISWRTGDVVQPLDYGSENGWFADRPPWREVYRSYTRIPLPFVTMRWGRWGFCFGAKGFGVDSDAYLRWLPAPEVYPGSVAMMLFTLRMTTALGPVAASEVGRR